MNQFKFDDLEEYFSTVDDEVSEHKVFVLIIYDVVDNKRRVKLSNFLQGYGFRVQKSAFEAMLPMKKYQKMVSEIPRYVAEEDSLRLYKIIGRGQVLTWGQDDSVEEEDVIII